MNECHCCVRFIIPNYLNIKTYVENIYNTISNDPGDCTSGIYTAKKEDISASPISNTDVTVPDCVRNSGVVTTSCRAYDKSGFHSRPSASCQLTLEAGEGQFFAQQKVTVLSESYRKLKGPRAIGAVSAKQKDGVTRSFSGRIACTNKRGTGRTCQSQATVRAISYPDSCLSLSEELENI